MLCVNLRALFATEGLGLMRASSLSLACVCGNPRQPRGFPHAHTPHSAHCMYLCTHHASCRPCVHPSAGQFCNILFNPMNREKVRIECIRPGETKLAVFRNEWPHTHTQTPRHQPSLSLHCSQSGIKFKIFMLQNIHVHARAHKHTDHRDTTNTHVSKTVLHYR